MKEPVDHILRPRLPWRETDAITECGYDASKVKAISRIEFFQRLKDLGRQRTAMLTCMTCSDTTHRWSSWEEDPRKALGREIEWESGWRRSDRGERLKDELLAIAEIVKIHQTEFSALVTEGEARRAWLAKKEDLKQRPKNPTPRVGGL